MISLSPHTVRSTSERRILAKYRARLKYADKICMKSASESDRGHIPEPGNIRGQKRMLRNIRKKKYTHDTTQKAKGPNPPSPSELEWTRTTANSDSTN